MLSVSQITKSFNGRVVLSDVTLAIYGGQKVALVGPNGIGKSVLLRIIAGIEKPDSGKIIVQEGVRIGYLPQELIESKGFSAKDYLWHVSGAKEMEEEMDGLSSSLDDPKKSARYAEVQAAYQEMGGYELDYRIRLIFQGLGLSEDALNRAISSLSGGEKSKVALCGLLMQNADILLLDEPTNNLDISSLVWLEEFIKKSPSTFLVVSHDRMFLDKIASKVMEIDWETRGINEQRGNYSDYLEHKRKELERQKQQYLEQKEEIARLEKSARDSRYWAQSGASQSGSDNDKMIRGRQRDRAAKSAKKATSIEKKIGQMDQIKRPMERPPMEMELLPIKSEAKQSIRLEDVVIEVGKNLKISPITMDIPYGSRTAILGDNGAGKTTLLSVITGDTEPTNGAVFVSESLVLGNLMQAHDDLPLQMEAGKFLIEKGGIKREQMYHLLSKFNFDPEESDKKISEFSPGGRTRLVLALFSALSANVLVLDEPTNHLDIDAMMALEEVLREYQGTVLVVSHDRYFLEHVRMDRFFLLAEGRLTSIPDYDAYILQTTKDKKRQLKNWTTPSS